MPWKLFRQLGLYGGAYAGFVSPVDCSELPLDPVNCVGIIKMRELRGSVSARRLVLGFCERAFTILMSDSTADWLDEPLSMKTDDRTASKWNAHIKSLREDIMRKVPVHKKDTVAKICARHDILPSELIKYNPMLQGHQGWIKGIEEVTIRWDPILLPAAFGELKHIARYFAVPKNEEEARAIWNGRRLSLSSKVPPNVFLPYLPDLLKEISDLDAQIGGVTIYTGDFRHFFHQIPSSRTLSYFFGVSIDGIIAGVLCQWAGLSHPTAHRASHGPRSFTAPTTFSQRTGRTLTLFLLQASKNCQPLSSLKVEDL